MSSENTLRVNHKCEKLEATCCWPGGFAPSCLPARIMNNLGRNDPCHCGSGRKYKKCHLDADQRSHLSVRQSQPDSEPASARAELENLPNLLEQFSKVGSVKDGNKFGELLSQTESLIEFLKRGEEIEAARAQLDTHRAEFERLAADPDRYLALAQTLFAEECFVPLRFTASEVREAFDHVGHPGTLLPDHQTAEILRAAILYIANDERRNWLAMSLLLRVPEFVAAGRHLEAWLLQYSSFQMTDQPGESNGFLFQMFSYGYDAWMAERRTKDKTFLNKLGLDLDRLQTMGVDEVDAWIQSQTTDAANSAAMEAFFREDPHLREELAANLESMERNSAALLEREDSRILQLPIEEMRPWVTVLNERVAQPGFPSDPGEARTPEEDALKMFDELVLPLMREMADAIFAPDRIRKTIADLRKYRGERFAAGDRVTANQAMGAISYLEREDDPGQNSFLISLCWASLNSAIKAGEAETPGA